MTLFLKSLIVTVLFNSVVLAKEQAFEDTIIVKVVVGDQVTVFDIKKKDSVLLLGSKIISELDSKFIKAQIQEALKHAGNDRQFCKRSYIEIASSNRQEKLACIGSSSKISKKFSDLANLLERASR